MSLPIDEPWTAQAVCAQTDPEAFFPEKGGSTREAKKVCSGCPVTADCLAYAIKHGERFGIWGGLSERERRKVGQVNVPRTTGLTDDQKAAIVTLRDGGRRTQKQVASMLGLAESTVRHHLRAAS